MYETVDKLRDTHQISQEQFALLLDTDDRALLEYLRSESQKAAQSVYGNKVFIRGLIEISSYCRNDCLYCGLRRSNRHAVRYRLSEEEIYACCENGYRMGFRTFVMQGGEDAWFSDGNMCRIVSTVKKRYPDCAVTLSLGERSRESYQRLFDAGADRYLLRHETADSVHYSRLHPAEMSFDNRMRCLFDLREIGYQVGCGFMVGSPFQTVETLFRDIRFIQRLKPEMCGIGPFIATQHTPFADRASGTVSRTLRLLSIIRLIHPHVLLPATTALATLSPKGREMGILSGANVVMPNLSPLTHRKDYNIYDNKVCTGEEAVECHACLKARMESIGYEIVVDRGDFRR